MSAAVDLRESPRWTRALVEIGDLEALRQIGPGAVHRVPPRPGLLALSVAARGDTAVAAARILARHGGLRVVAAESVPDSDLVVVLSDALGPRRGSVTCNAFIPRALHEVLDDCRRAICCAAEAGVPVMLLRRTALGGASTLLSSMIDHEDVDPAYDVACATSRIVAVLGKRA